MVDKALIKESNSQALSFWKPNIIFLAFVVLSSPIISFADLNTDISISATVVDDSQSGAGNSNNNSSFGNINATSPDITPTDITFSGVAYPKTKVILLLNGTKAAETNAGPDASFSLKLSSLIAGLKVFSIVAEDIEGVRSVLVTLPITIKDRTSTNISNLFIAPTLSLNKTSYGRGENISVHGYSVPGSTVLFVVDSKDNINISANNLGFYIANIKTDSFSLGDHAIQAKTKDMSGIKIKTSGLGQLSSFFITLRKKEKIEDKPNIVADINSDSVINISDFSILAFWYQKPTAPKTIDLNGDGKITMTDFSILAYYWNG
jgi:hypothetical protein